jgi:hypothetical protein
VSCSLSAVDEQTSLEAVRRVTRFDVVEAARPWRRDLAALNAREHIVNLSSQTKRWLG